MTMNDQKNDPTEDGFKVNDRRSFSDDGSPRRQEPAQQAGEQPSAPSQEPLTEQQPQAAPQTTASETPPLDLPAVEFEALVSILTTPALVFLGLINNPENDKQEVNLPMAQQQISLVELLQQKSKGNLDAKENEFIESALFQLRMAYLKTSGKL